MGAVSLYVMYLDLKNTSLEVGNFAYNFLSLTHWPVENPCLSTLNIQWKNINFFLKVEFVFGAIQYYHNIKNIHTIIYYTMETVCKITFLWHLD